MVNQLTMTLLHRAQTELRTESYKHSDDRILVALDMGRNVIYPARSRTPLQMTNITFAYQEATRQIAKTSLGRDVPEEKDAYMYLTMLGKDIPIEGLRFLLHTTLARLKQEAMDRYRTLEAAQ